MITKQHAEAIIKKLQAEIHTKRDAHDLAVVYHNGKRIASFGIRRGSRKNLGHNHISHDLHVSPHTCLGLAQCPVSKDEWLEMMGQKGLIN